MTDLASSLPVPAPHRIRRPPAPVPHDAPLGTVSLLLALRRNVLSTWTRAHFERPVVHGRGVLGAVAVVSDPQLIRHVLVDNAANYPKDPLQRRMLSAGLGKGLLMAEGDEWRAQRRALAPLFSPRHVHGFEAAMADEATALVARWLRSRDGRRLDAAAEMSRVTLKILARTIFSEALTRTVEDFVGVVGRYLDTVGQIDPLDLLDMPAWVPRLGRLRNRPRLRFLDAAVETMIRRRRQVLAEAPASAPQDLLTLLLQARDPETGSALSEDEVKANLVTFIIAGHETTSNALTWSLFLLAGDAEARAAVEREVDRLMPEGRMPPGQLDAFHHTRASIEEAMRLYPPAATISRMAAGPDRLGDLPIRARTTIVISPYVLHRHRRLWDHPDAFVPAHFLPENRGRIDRFAYLPFGAGPRVCIGAAFALQEAVAVLATVMRHVRLTVVPGHVPMPVERVTLRPQGGMPMLVRRRPD